MSTTRHETSIGENADSRFLFDGEYSTLFARAMSGGELRTFLLQAVLSEDFGKGSNGLLPIIEKKDIDKASAEPKSDRPLTRLEVMGIKLDFAQEWTDASSVVALRKVVRSESGDILSDGATLRVRPPLSE